MLELTFKIKTEILHDHGTQLLLVFSSSVDGAQTYIHKDKGRIHYRVDLVNNSEVDRITAWLKKVYKTNDIFIGYKEFFTIEEHEYSKDAFAVVGLHSRFLVYDQGEYVSTFYSLQDAIVFCDCLLGEMI